MAKLPAIQFYPGDWRKDPGIQALNFEERGVWLELLFLMHESETRGKLLLAGKPITEERLANILHIDKQKITTHISTFLELGVASLCEETGAVMNRRMVRDEILIEKRRKAGKQGGNPVLQPGKPNPYYKKDKQKDKQADKQKITPSSSSSITINNIDNSFEIFADALSIYPGTKRGPAVEFEYFKKTHKEDWPQVLRDLRPAIEQQAAERIRKKKAGAFVPEWKHFKTWIYNKCYTETHGNPQQSEPTVTNPKTFSNQKELADHFGGGINEEFVRKTGQL